MPDTVQSPFSGAVLKESKTTCTSDGKSTASSANSAPAPKQGY